MRSMEKPVLSVVIGFRDWGTDRVKRSAQSILAAFDGLPGEVVISDYGSVDPQPSRQVAEALGSKYVYTPGDPVWSRSRALNAGFKVAEGDLLISTDADMLFSPSSMRVIAQTAAQLEQCALFLQCRDLPSWMDDDYFQAHPQVDWELLEREGRLRPRWGMGGMMAISAKGFEALRGFDERLHTYGGEDLDFAQRARRAGYRTVWVDHPDVRMYHMYHPPSLQAAQQTEAGRRAVQANKDILKADRSTVRNVVNWQHTPHWSNPLVSVVIATRDRADLLVEAIRSVLVQSVQDFEVVVVDDGSVQDVRGAVAALQDDRVRYFRQEAAGISAARNLGLDVSRGYFTAVLDDDDLMPPQRLEWQIGALTDGFVGSVGSFINFDDVTGELQPIVSKHPTIANAIESGGAPGHGTWLIRTDVMRTLRYDESIPSGIDNNFFLRLLRTGYSIAHCGYPVLLRRRHNGQVTVTDGERQSDAAKQALQFFRFGVTKWHVDKLSEEAKTFSYPAVTHSELAERIRPFLPDHLVERDATLLLAELPQRVPDFDGHSRLEILTKNGELLRCSLTVRRASYPDLVRLRSLGDEVETRLSTADESPESWAVLALRDYLEFMPPEARVLVRRGDAPGEEDDRTATYARTVGSKTSSISISSPESSRPGPSDWLVVGTPIEEYWA